MLGLHNTGCLGFAQAYFFKTELLRKTTLEYGN
jgi:hypothetical protein